MINLFLFSTSIYFSVLKNSFPFFTYFLYPFSFKIEGKLLNFLTSE